MRRRSDTARVLRAVKLTIRGMEWLRERGVHASVRRDSEWYLPALLVRYERALSATHSELAEAMRLLLKGGWIVVGGDQYRDFLRRPHWS